jgi:uncharacterized protein YjbI with pentapeptide repeats
MNCHDKERAGPRGPLQKVSIWNHAIPIGSLIIAGVSALLANQARQTAREANEFARKANAIQVSAVNKFENANKIAMIASVREASVNARLLFEDPKYTINGMDFSYLRFSTYKFPKKDMQRIKLSFCNLSWAKLDDARLGGALLEEANLWGAKLEGAELWGATLTRADLRHANCRKANLRGAKLNKSRLEGTDLRGADLRGAHFEGARLGALKVRNLTFKGEGASPKDRRQVWKEITRATDLRGADLRGATLKDVDFSAVLHDEKTRWPSGFKPPKMPVKSPQ